MFHVDFGLDMILGTSPLCNDISDFYDYKRAKARPDSPIRAAALMVGAAAPVEGPPIAVPVTLPVILADTFVALADLVATASTEAAVIV